MNSIELNCIDILKMNLLGFDWIRVGGVVTYSSLVKFTKNVLLPTDLVLKTENSKAFIYLTVRAITFLKNELFTEMN